MAIFTRTSGDAKGVVHVDTAAAGGGIGTIISTGIGKRPTIFLLDTGSVDLRGQTGVGGAVEAMLRAVAVQSSLIAYQVEDNDSGEVRVMVEATGYDAAGLQAAVRALGTVNGANLGSTTAAVVGLKS
jgi:hypothetical protein